MYGKLSFRGQTSRERLHVFLPNSPNIATGHFFMVSESQVFDTDITTDQACRLIMSGGLVERDKEFNHDS